MPGDVVSFLVYVGAHIAREQERMSGNVVYDYFMGAWLNPRFGLLDLKMLLETRVAWIMLFYVTVGAASKQYDLTGEIHPAMWFMLLGHFLYANACMKVGTGRHAMCGLCCGPSRGGDACCSNMSVELCVACAYVTVSKCVDVTVCSRVCGCVKML